MALIRPGAAAAQISGRLGGDVFSHNRYGSYVRRGSIPVTVTSPAALLAKSILTDLSQNWGNLTLAQRTAWQDWAQTHPVFNRIGDQVILSGNAAYIQLNARLRRAGASDITDPPVVAAPAALTSASASYDIGAGDFNIAFTPATLAAGQHLWVNACLVNSPGINYVENLLRTVTVEAAATASPVDMQTAMQDRFGTLQVDQVVHYRVGIFDGNTGLLSSLFPLRGQIVST